MSFLPLSSCLSDSLDNSDCLPPSCLFIMSASKRPLYLVEVTQVLSTHASVIGKSLIRPRQLEKFEYNCKCYFSYKEIREVKQVKRVMFNIDAFTVHVWMKENEVILKALIFAGFIDTALQNHPVYKLDIEGGINVVEEAKRG